MEELNFKTLGSPTFRDLEEHSCVAPALSVTSDCLSSFSHSQPQPRSYWLEPVMAKVHLCRSMVAKPITRLQGWESSGRHSGGDLSGDQESWIGAPEDVAASVVEHR